MSDELAEWLSEKIETQGLTIRELAKRAGLAHTTVADVISRRAKPGSSFCNGIARALSEPPERVFRMAGILPPIVIGQDEEQECLDYIRLLNTEERHAVLALARALYEQRARNDMRSARKHAPSQPVQENQLQRLFDQLDADCREAIMEQMWVMLDQQPQNEAEAQMIENFNRMPTYIQEHVLQQVEKLVRATQERQKAQVSANLQKPAGSS